MKITPLDIRRKEFKRSMRGYSDEEVDVFLDEVADEFERLFQENMELHDRTQRLDEQIAGHAQLRDALEKTLVSAQMQAEEMRANAHKESELILRDAELKARGVVSDSYSDTQKMQQSLVQLKLLEEDFRFKFRSLLEGYLRLLSQASLTTAGVEQRLPAAAPAPDAVEAPPAPPAPAVVAQTAEVPAAASMVGAVASDDTATHETTYDVGGPCGVPGRYAGQSDDGDASTEQAVAEPDMAVPVPVGPGDEPLDTDTFETPELEAPEEVPAADDTSPRGFFFGRKMEDLDDTFAGEEGAKKDTTRDFEW